MRNEGNAKPILLKMALISLFIMMIMLLQSLYSVTAAATSQEGIKDVPSEIDNAAVNNNSTLANCRYGITTAEHTAQILPMTGAGVFYKFNQPNWYGPLPPGNAQLLHMIKTRQRKTSTGEYLPGWYTDGVKLNDELAGYIRADLGATWIVGNEVERGPNPGETWTARTGDMYPEVYAEAYHEIYNFIKTVDPTARVANAGLIQVTPMRLQYLDKVWNAYSNKYGEDMPVDVWTIHTYVLPELTADGQPNNIASAALGTDINLGKRAAGGDTSKCPDYQVYCILEHDDLAILKDQVVAMRQWMKAHGQQDKPLIITEYGTLYHYRVKDDGDCGRKDELGNCFDPPRVTKFMLDSFAYFNNQARDADLGLASDDNRLVQQWIWYGAWEWDIGSSNLLVNWNSSELSMMGKAFRDHVQAEPTYVNLVVDEVVSKVIAYEDDETATAAISVNIRNNGNVPLQESFKVTFYRDQALTQPIGSTTIAATLAGCAARAYNATVEWSDLPQGVHPFWVKVDSDNEINELPANNDDNIGSGQVEATGPVYALDVEIISDGQGEGGVVTSKPNESVLPEGTEVTLTAIPFAGWSFEGWSGAIVGSAPTVKLTIFNDTFVQARFKQGQYQLDIRKSGQGTVLVSPASEQGYYLYGDEVQLQAVPESGWRFAGWSGDVTSELPTVKIVIEDNVLATATFEQYLTDIVGAIHMPVIYRR